MSELILVINSGSSSVKFQVFAYEASLSLLAQGKVFKLGSGPCFSALNTLHPHQESQKTLKMDCTHEEAILLIIEWIKEQLPDFTIKATVHRIVHGGELFAKSILINEQVIEQLKQLNALAPLHQPHNIAAVEIIANLMPNMNQVACFDTAFHATHSPLFTTYALPKNIREQGIRRYGFHGLSYQWIAHILKQDYPELALGRIVVAHLGNGASLCAMKQGVSIDTTMGLTALDGLPIGTRCGSLDPGAITYMQRHLKLDYEKIEQILYNESGLLGLSGITNDVQQLQERAGEQSQFALNYFCLKVAQYIAMMAVSLNGIDALVFTGGIGENSESLRRQILKQLKILPSFAHLVIPANEEKMMAIEAFQLVLAAPF